MNTEEVLFRFAKVHGNRYDYSCVDYTGSRNKVKIGCPLHGYFWQMPYKHLYGQGCPRCKKLIWNSQDTTLITNGIDIAEYIRKYLPDCEGIILNDDSALGGGMYIDIYIPSRKIGIDLISLGKKTFDGSNGRFYHLNKSERCCEMGIRLVQVFEDEYNSHREAVLSRILHILGLNGDLHRIPARKCTVREIVKPVAKWFLDRNDVGGYTNCTVAVGCHYKSMLIGVMCLTRVRNDSDEWVLTRFACENAFLCQGVCSKMFRWFVRKYNPSMVKSLVDRAWTTDLADNIYTRMGFKLDKEIDPDYKYVLDDNPTDRIEKFELLKKKIRTDNGISLDATETDVAKALGMSKVWNCGKARYKWLKKEKAG